MITQCDKIYYKVSQVLKNETEFFQNMTRGCDKCENYYKVRLNKWSR